LVKLSLENDEISSSFTVEVNNLGLEFLEGIDNLQEVIVCQEESVISFFNFGNDGFNWEKQCILIEVLLQSIMLKLLQLIKSGLLLGHHILNQSISLYQL
jgi:hypothetical protein